MKNDFVNNITIKLRIYKKCKECVHLFIDVGVFQNK